MAADQFCKHGRVFKMIQNFLQIVGDSLKTILPNSGIVKNYWFWIALGELCIIIYTAKNLFQKRKLSIDSKTEEILSNSKKSKFDMGNLLDNINKSRDLYKILSSKCHPDRFHDIEKNKKADEIFQEITRNKRNYGRLIELKELAKTELNISV